MAATNDNKKGQKNPQEAEELSSAIRKQQANISQYNDSFDWTTATLTRPDLLTR